MSTKSTIIHLPDRHIHLYRDAGGEHLGITLEYEATGVEAGDQWDDDLNYYEFWRSPNGASVPVTLRFDNDDFDAMVDAYVAKREKRRSG